MNTNQIQYSGVSQGQIDVLVADLPSHGSTVQNQSPKGGPQVYIISGHGVTVNAVYTGNNLMITVTKKPFYIPFSAIERGLSGALGIAPIAPGAPVVMVPKPNSEPDPLGSIGDTK